MFNNVKITFLCKSIDILNKKNIQNCMKLIFRYRKFSISIFFRCQLSDASLTTVFVFYKTFWSFLILFFREEHAGHTYRIHTSVFNGNVRPVSKMYTLRSACNESLSFHFRNTSGESIVLFLKSRYSRVTAKTPFWSSGHKFGMNLQVACEPTPQR